MGVVVSIGQRDGNPKETAPKLAIKAGWDVQLPGLTIFLGKFPIKSECSELLVGSSTFFLMYIKPLEFPVKLSQENSTNLPYICSLKQTNRCQIPFARYDYPRETSLKMFHQIKFHEKSYQFPHFSTDSGAVWRQNPMKPHRFSYLMSP